MKLTEVSMKTIDPTQAAQMLIDYPYERQRTVNRHYVGYYAQMMTNGEWVEGTEIAIAYAPNGDGHLHGHLVNGQHRLMAVVEAGVPIDFTTKTFVCDDDEEIAKLYGMIDTGRSRNMGDYLRALSMENEFGFSPSDNLKLSSAVRVILGKFQKANKIAFTPGEQLEAMRKYSVAASAYLEILADAANTISHRKMRTSAVDRKSVV